MSQATNLIVGSIVNVYGSKVNFDHCVITQETGKAFKFEVDNAFGQYLHEYHVTFWLPKSVSFKNLSDGGSYGLSITLPHWFKLTYHKEQIGSGKSKNDNSADPASGMIQANEDAYFDNFCQNNNI